MKKRPIIYLAAAAMMAATAGGVSAQETHKLIIWTHASSDDVVTISMMRWAKIIEEKSAGRLKPTIIHSAKRYKASNAPTALARGLIDIGSVGHEQLGKFVPEAGIVKLPLVYGATPEQLHALSDGEIGKELNAKLEKKLGVKVIGRWLDYAYAALFFLDKKVTTHADIVGLKMRFPGGQVLAEILKVFGAKPTKIPWRDLPPALKEKRVDGFRSTHEAVRSAKLWEVGVKYAFHDRLAFAQYVPMVSGKTWRKLPKDLRKLIVDSWEAFIPEQRKFAKQHRAEAREDEKKNGMTIINARPEDIAAMRKKLLAAQPAMVERLKMDKDFVARAQRAIEEAGTM